MDAVRGRLRCPAPLHTIIIYLYHHRGGARAVLLPYTMNERDFPLPISAALALSCCTTGSMNEALCGTGRLRCPLTPTYCTISSCYEERWIGHQCHSSLDAQNDRWMCSSAITLW